MNNPKELTHEQISQLLDAFVDLKAWISTVEEYALTQITNGVSIPNYELGTTRPSRIWVNEQQVIDQLLSDNNSIDDIAPRELLSVAKMEKLLKKQFANIADKVGSKPGNLKLVKKKVEDF